MPTTKKTPQKIDAIEASTKTLFLRVSPELHSALVMAAGAEQQRCGRHVSVNLLATRILADALGLAVEDKF